MHTGDPAPDAIVNGMSVDVEDYFQVSAFDHDVPRATWDQRASRVRANTTRLLELFDEFQVKATFFVLGWIAAKYPGLVREIAAGGHEIASHGYHHRLVYELSPDEFRDDIRRAKQELEAIGGRPVIGYRAPSYSVTEQSRWALDVLVEEGYRYDTSIFPIHHDRYGIADAPRDVHVLTRRAGSLIEVPPSTVRCAGVNLPVGGGGYFRLLPYAWTRWGFRRINAVERRPAIFYLHPWEIDPAQPRIDTNALSRTRHYRNLNKTEPRLRQLMHDFPFSTIADVLGTLTAQTGDALLCSAGAPVASTGPLIGPVVPL